jgi:hypothetical protein
MANPKAITKGVQQVEGGLYDLYFEFPVGATGAVGTLVRNREISAITRLGAGNYRVSLREAWNAIMDWGINVLDATPAGTDGQNVVASVRTPGGATPVFEFFTRQVSGAAADPRNGAVIVGRIRLQNGQRV